MHMTSKCIIIMTQVHLGKFRVIKKKCQIRVGSIFLFWRNIHLKVFFTQKLLMTLKFSMVLSQGHLGKFRVTGMISDKFMSCSYLFMEKDWKSLLHTKTVYDLWMCHNFISKLLGHVQCHWKEKCNISVRSSTFIWINIESSDYRLRLVMVWGSGMI